MIFIKIAGILTVFASCSLWGLFSAFSLKSRAKNLDSVCKSIGLLKNHINHSGEELKTVLKQSFNECKFIKFNDVSPVFSSSELKSKDKEILTEFFKSLGTSERSGENEKIDLYLKIFENEKEKAKQEAEQKCKIFSVSGVCIGITAAILFI